MLIANLFILSTLVYLVPALQVNRGRTDAFFVPTSTCQDYKAIYYQDHTTKKTGCSCSLYEQYTFMSKKRGGKLECVKFKDTGCGKPISVTAVDTKIDLSCHVNILKVEIWNLSKDKGTWEDVTFLFRDGFIVDSTSITLPKVSLTQWSGQLVKVNINQRCIPSGLSCFILKYHGYTDYPLQLASLTTTVSPMTTTRPTIKTTTTSLKTTTTPVTTTTLKTTAKVPIRTTIFATTLKIFTMLSTKKSVTTVSSSTSIIIVIAVVVIALLVVIVAVLFVCRKRLLAAKVKMHKKIVQDEDKPNNYTNTSINMKNVKNVDNPFYRNSAQYICPNELNETHLVPRLSETYLVPSEVTESYATPTELSKPNDRSYSQINPDDHQSSSKQLNTPVVGTNPKCYAMPDESSYIVFESSDTYEPVQATSQTAKKANDVFHCNDNLYSGLNNGTDINGNQYAELSIKNKNSNKNQNKNQIKNQNKFQNKNKIKNQSFINHSREGNLYSGLHNTENNINQYASLSNKQESKSNSQRASVKNGNQSNNNTYAGLCNDKKFPDDNFYADLNNSKGSNNGNDSLYSGLANQNDDLYAGLTNQNDGLYQGLANQNDDLYSGLTKQNDSLYQGLANQKDDLYSGLTNQNDSLYQGLANQNDDLYSGLTNQSDNLYSGLTKQKTGKEHRQVNGNSDHYSDLQSCDSTKNYESLQNSKPHTDNLYVYAETSASPLKKENADQAIYHMLEEE